MKKKIAVCLLGGILTMTSYSYGVQAMTIGMDNGKKIYTITYEEGNAVSERNVQIAEEDVKVMGAEQGESIEQATENAAGTDTAAEDPDLKRKVQEYKQNGIEQDLENGSWVWQEKEVQILMDEDGSFYQNGSEAAKEAQIYLIVKRDENGEIQKVKQITIEEAMEKFLD